MPNHSGARGFANPRTVLPSLLLSGLLLVLGVGAHARFGTYHAFAPSGHALGLDDAFITFRYAESLADGHGLVYNPGERVEGYSNLLYTLVIAALALALDEAHLYAGSLILNTALALATMLILSSTLRRRAGPAAGIIGALLFALTPTLWVWTGSGLETALYVLCIVGAWSVADRDNPAAVWQLAAWCGALVLVRVDGFIPVAIILTWLMISGRRNTAVRAGAVGLVTLAAVTLWRLGYYGYPLSNTFYAKYDGPLAERYASGVRGVRYAVRAFNFWLYGTVLIAAGSAVAARWLRGNGVDGVRGLELGLALPFVAYFVHVGGDDLGDRFLAPAIVMAICILASWVGRLDADARRVALSCAVAASLAALATDPRMEFRRDKYDFLVELGVWLRSEQPGATLATGAAGKVPFFSGLRAIDMLGLNDEYIAHTSVKTFRVGHSKYDPDYVLGRRPDVVVVGVDAALDGAWGLGRDRYVASGYCVSHLVNTRPVRRARNIVDVRGLTAVERGALLVDGFDMAVLVRVQKKGPHSFECGPPK